MDQPEAWRMIRRIGRRAELDGAGEISPHSLRVAFITSAQMGRIASDATFGGSGEWRAACAAA